MRPRLLAPLALAGAVTTTACNAPRTTESGFLSDYSRLEKLTAGHLRWVSDKLASYDGFIVDNVEIRTEKEPPVLTPEQRAEVARYMRDRIEEFVQDAGYTLHHDAGVGIAVFRVAITDVRKAKWFLNLHPGSKLSGLGLGGATLEAEVNDSVTGEQLAAIVRAARGNQFEFDQFSALDDIKDVINTWAAETRERLGEIRDQAGSEP